MEENFKQDFFISNDGYINLRLKVETNNKQEREKIVADLMGRLINSQGFELSKLVSVDQIYFQNQSPVSVLKDVKKTLITDIESYFNNIIEQS